MAFGFLCTKCGWQETPHHGIIHEVMDPNKRIPGRRFTLAHCPGYTSPSPEEEVTWGIHELRRGAPRLIGRYVSPHVLTTT